MNSFEPTKHEPMGAPAQQHSAWLYDRTRELGLTQSLTKAQANGVKGSTEYAQRGTRLCRNVPDPGTVKMHLQTLAVHIFRNLHDLILREYGAIERVFERDYLCCRTIKKVSVGYGDQRPCAQMDIISEDNVRLNVGESKVVTCQHKGIQMSQSSLTHARPRTV